MTANPEAGEQERLAEIRAMHGVRWLTYVEQEALFAALDARDARIATITEERDAANTFAANAQWNGMMRAAGIAERMGYAGESIATVIRDDAASIYAAPAAAETKGE